METYVVSILSATIGAAVAVFTNFWRTRYTIRAQDFSKRVEELAALIRKLETLASERWSPAKDAILPNLIPSILGTQGQISLMIKYLHDEYENFDKTQISESLATFFDACTGGDFDNLSSSPSDSNRLRRILVEGEKLRIELLKTRNKLY